MLKLTLREGEYVNIGDNIRVVYAGGSGKNGRLMIDAPREMNISRSNNDPNPEKRKDTYYPEPRFQRKHSMKLRRLSGMKDRRRQNQLSLKQISKHNTIS